MIKILNSKQFKRDLNLILDKTINYYWKAYERKVLKSNGLSTPSEWKKFYTFVRILKNTKKDKIKKIFKYISHHPVLDEIIYDKDKKDGIFLQPLNDLNNFFNDSPICFKVTNKDGTVLCNIDSTSQLFNIDVFLNLNNISIELFRFNHRFFSSLNKISIIKYEHKYMDSIYKDILKIAPVIKRIDRLFYLHKKSINTFKIKKYKTIDDLKLSPIYVDRTSPFKGYNEVSENKKTDYYIDSNNIYYPFILNNYEKFLKDININDLNELRNLFKYARVIRKYLNQHDILAYSRFFKLNGEEGLYTGIYNINDQSDYYFYIKIDTTQRLNDIRSLSLYSYLMVAKNTSSLIPYYANDSLVKTEYTLNDYIENYEDVITMESLSSY